MNNIYEIILSASKKYSKNVLFSNEKGIELTYENFINQIDNAFRFFDEVYNETQFNFSIICPNCPNYLYVLFSLLRKKCTAVNLNPNLSQQELIDRLSLAEVSVIFTTKSIYHRIKDFFKSYSLHNIYIIDDDDINFNVLESIPYDSSIKANRNQNELAFLQFTGGTTGIIKAAAISHQNVIANIKQLSLHFEKYNKIKSYILLITFPFYHIFSVVFNFLFFASNGSKMVLFKDLRNFEYIIAKLSQHQVTFIVGVNTWYNKLMQHPNFLSLNTKNIELCFAGGEYVPLVTKEKWKRMTGKELYSAYGLTETCSLSIISPLDNSNIDDSIGEAIPGTEVVLLDENNNVINENNTHGEIALKGFQITNQYYNNIMETQNSFYDGFFKTGDIAIKLENRFYRIVDRKKDMISISGNKVYPNEIEEALIKLNGVLDVAIVGKLSAKTGEEIVAYLVVDEQVITLDEIVLFCKQNFTKFKVPKEYVLLHELPKTPIGKTYRKELRELANKKN